MIYALTITIAAGLLLLAVLGGAALVARRAQEDGGWPSIGRWRWYPNALGLTVLVLVAGLLLWRLFPALLLVPIVLPFFWRRRFFRGPRSRRDQEDQAIEGRYRPFDDR